MLKSWKGDFMKKTIKVIFLIIFLLILLSNINYGISDEALIPKNNYETVRIKARIVSTGNIYDDTSTGFTAKTQEVAVRVLEGEYKNKVFPSKYVLSYDIDNKILCYPLDKHNTVFIQINTIDGEIQNVLVEDVVRQNYIFWMIAVFFVLILLIGGKQGIKAILSLVITILLIAFVTVQSIFNGHSPITMSILTCVITIILCFIITGGINKKTLTAMLGTSGGVILSAIVAILFGYLAKLSGGGEEAVMLSINAAHISFNFRELLYAGIVISSLGACMDIGMSIASALDELKQKNEHMTWKELMKSGMNIGKDVMATMTNTLILAYVGGSLTLILLFLSADFGIMDMINKETIASEIIGALAASTGVICTIPITSFIYALFFKEKKDNEKKSVGGEQGKRELKI